MRSRHPLKAEVAYAKAAWSASTVKRWVDKSDRFERVGAAGAGKSKIVRRPADAEA